MKGPLFLLFCTEMLGVLLFGAQTIATGATAAAATQTQNAHDSDSPTSPSSSSSSVAFLSTDTTTESEATSLPPKVPQFSTGHNNSPVPQPVPTSTAFQFYIKECVPVFFVAGGLIIGCAFLLVCTLLLLWKVCQLNRRIKMLSSSSDLISTSNYWVGTAKKDKNKAGTEAKETSVLMSDICQAHEETGNGTTKEEEGKVNGQTGEENKKDGEDAAKSEDAAATPAQNASTQEPQEEASAAAPSSQGTEEPKDVV